MYVGVSVFGLWTRELVPTVAGKDVSSLGVGWFWATQHECWEFNLNIQQKKYVIFISEPSLKSHSLNELSVYSMHLYVTNVWLC